VSVLRHTFPTTHRLHGAAAFAAVYDAGIREARGPLAAFVRANALDHPRLGLSVSRRVGTAVQRNRIKRLLREAFRMMQHDFPAAYDLVLAVRPHRALALADYQKILTALIARLHQKNTLRTPLR
jgi:ribonuclease P protein component